jgi:hypothetical protein
MNNELDAKVVYISGWDSLRIPPRMGIPRPDQMRGSIGAQLSELCGRVCYDSLGKGRSSEGYHKHIREVGHHSVNEHFHLTVEVDTHVPLERIVGYVNRPGVYLAINKSNKRLRITANPRVLIDWDKHPKFIPGKIDIEKAILCYAFANTCPEIVDESWQSWIGSEVEIVPAEDPYEIHLSVYFRGSRGFSHEQVRHRTAISQRSTRYVDENESNWVKHPLLEQYLQKHPGLTAVCDAVENNCKDLYGNLVKHLQTFVKADKLTARKQARGAARGYLGNALPTELIVTASLAQWKHMFSLRMTDAADAEIRLVYNKLWDELWNMKPVDLRLQRYLYQLTKEAKDGCGFVLAD